MTTRLKRPALLRRPKNQKSRDADRVGRFQREAGVLASVNHPNIAVEKARHEKVEEFPDKFANPYIAAERGFVDEIIEPKSKR
jgi:hypothetical protein